MNNRNSFAFVILLAGLLCLPTTVLAEKIGYVDARRLIDESPQGQEELKALEDKFSVRNREIKGRIDLFQAEEAELQKNAVLMAPADVEKKTEELREIQRNIKRDQRDYSEEYNASRNRSLAELQKIVSDAVIFIAERDKYDLIVQQAVYASSEINLTETVLQELIKRAGK